MQFQQQQVANRRTRQPLRNKPLTRPDINRAQTPPVQHAAAKDDAYAPSTPRCHETNFSREDASPELATFCPQPRYAAGDRRSELREFPSLPGSPGQDAGRHELHEILASAKASAAEHGRPLSSVSTSAGPTPSPDDRVRSPYYTSFGTPVDNASQRQTPTPGASEVAKRAGPGAQARKIFVGGVPQDMTQEELFSLFNEFAAVKKAWLQRYKDTGPDEPIPYNHRGFGFVIFQEPGAVDQLLGPHGFSRYHELRNGRKLEIKRAVSSVDMSDDMPGKKSPVAMARPQMQAQVRQSGASEQAPILTPTPFQRPPAHLQSLPALQRPQQEVGSVTAQPCSYMMVPMQMQPSQMQASQMQLAQMQRTSLPVGAMQRPEGQWNLGLQNFAPPATQVALPAPAPRALQLQALDQYKSKQDLEYALLQAMPDHYDD